METARKKIVPNPDGSLPANYRLGEYRIKSVLGIGGFGITYLARDTKLGALVAIKEYFPQSMAFRSDRYTIIPRGRGNATVAQNYSWGLKEFLKEARVLAKFKHQNIVRVLRFIEGNGSAYMVMEYEKGQSLAEFLKKRGGFLNEKDLLNVFLPILSGLQAVHKAGILHLDIKPDNIYLRSDGQPMLIDFGSAGQVAKESDDKKAIALTPAYSAVENYPDMGEKGPWSDIYSIGATFYRCITGKHPKNSMDRHEARAAGKNDPLKAAISFERPRYAGYIRESIDWSLEINQEDRPQSALTLQQGIMGRGRFKETSDENNFNKFRSGFIGVVNVREETKKTGRSLFEITVFSLLVLTVVGFYLTTTGAIDKDYILSSANDIKKIITGSGGDKEVEEIKNKFATAIETAQYNILGIEPPKKDMPAKKEEALSKNIPVKIVPVFNPDVKLVSKIKNRYGNIRHLKFAGKNNLLLASSDGGRVRVWSLDSGKRMKSFSYSRKDAPEIAVSSDGNLIAIADNENVVLIDAMNLQTIAMLVGHTDLVTNISFSPAGDVIATSGKDKKLILWNIHKQKIIKKISLDKIVVSSLDFSPNGKRLASSDESGGIRYWESKTGKLLASFPVHKGRVTSIIYSGDGRWLATAGDNKFLKLLSTGATVKDQVPEQIPADIQNIAITPDGKWLLAAGTSASIYLWNIAKNRRMPDLPGHRGEIFSIALSPDTRIIAAAGLSSEISIWRSNTTDDKKPKKTLSNQKTAAGKKPARLITVK
ncbi:MAG: protein kinase [Acidiferrobacterales bacterium]